MSQNPCGQTGWGASPLLEMRAQICRMGQPYQMFDENVEVVTDDPIDARQRAWAALKKVVHRADGTAAMPKGWPGDHDDPRRRAVVHFEASWCRMKVLL